MFAAGLIIRDLPLTHSSFRAAESLGDYLTHTGTVAIADIDTRKLTRILREGGAQAGCIMAGGIEGKPARSSWPAVWQHGWPRPGPRGELRHNLSVATGRSAAQGRLR